MRKLLARELLLLLLVPLLASAAGKKKDKDGKKENFQRIDLYGRGDGGSSVKVKKGMTVKMFCVAPVELNETMRISWYRNGGEIIDNHLFPSHFNIDRISLTINKIKGKDGGEYGCRWTDVEEAPQETRYGGSVNITIEKGPPNKQEGKKEGWKELESEYEDFDDEEAERRYEESVDCNNKRRNTLNLTLEEEYLCFDFEGQKNHRMNRFYVQAAGTQVTLQCNPRGNPKPVVTWYKDNNLFSPVGYHYKISDHSLTIKEVTMNDEAIYACKASNRNETILYEITLRVTHRVPMNPILEKISNQTLLVGGVLRIACVEEYEEYSLVDPHLSFIKHLENGTMAPAKNVTVMRSENAILRVEILSDAEYFIQWVKHFAHTPEKYSQVKSRTNDTRILKDHHVLYLENVTMEDAGWYTCLAANSIGKANTSVYIDVVTEIPTATVSKITHQNDMIFWLSVGAPISLMAVIIIFVAFFWSYKSGQLERYKQKLQEHGVKGWTKVVVIDRVPARDSEEGGMMIPEVNIKSVLTSTTTDQEYELPMDENWEFARDSLILGKYLGQGDFGEVCQATAHGIIERGSNTTVAVKTLKSTHSDADMIDLISEMETMKELGKHPNIINLLGCCTVGGELLVIMEFAEHGSLLEFLRSNRNNYCYENPKNPQQIPDPPDSPPTKVPLTFRDLMSYSFQVARGMDYLSQKKYVHRDLAARNVLINADHVAKICDFGMTRSTFANDYYRKKSDGRVPIKWMAPETLIHRVYTTQSDVWSYGILLWEIVTLGGSPYPTIPDTNYLLEFLRSGQRMSHPPNCPTELYIIMRDCWMDTPTGRPTFGQLVEDIGRILYIASETEYFEMVDGEGVYSPQEIITPPDSPENSAAGLIMFDPEFIKSFTTTEP